MRKNGATQHKLEEAAFFLGFLKQNYGREKKFDFYLSAYLGAARAVTWIMRSEYGKVAGWEDWFSAVKVDGDVARLLGGTTDARNRSLKIAPFRTFKEALLEGITTETGDSVEGERLMQRIVREQIPADIGGSTGQYTVTAVVDGQPITLNVRLARFDRRLEEFPDQNILDVCHRYYDFLAKLVADCEAKFGS